MPAEGCTSRCNHVDPDGPWPHATKLREDAGEIHTDDCIDVCKAWRDDDFEHCTAGQPGSKCRVAIVEGRVKLPRSGFHHCPKCKDVMVLNGPHETRTDSAWHCLNCGTSLPALLPGEGAAPNAG